MKSTFGDSRWNHDVGIADHLLFDRKLRNYRLKTDKEMWDLKILFQRTNENFDS